MIQAYHNNLLDFLAEGFLEQGASVTYMNFSGTPALKVTAEDGSSKLYISSEEEVSKMSFLEQLTSAEILVPVLRSEDEMRLKAALHRRGISGVKVYRLSLKERYAWYSREFLNRKMDNSVLASGSYGR